MNWSEFYTNSKIVLGYIHNVTKRFYVYVANRVTHIRNSTHPVVLCKHQQQSSRPCNQAHTLKAHQLVLMSTFPDPSKLKWVWDNQSWPCRASHRSQRFKQTSLPLPLRFLKLNSALIALRGSQAGKLSIKPQHDSFMLPDPSMKVRTTPTAEAGMTAVNHAVQVSCHKPKQQSFTVCNLNPSKRNSNALKN